MSVLLRLPKRVDNRMGVLKKGCLNTIAHRWRSVPSLRPFIMATLFVVLYPMSASNPEYIIATAEQDQMNT